MFVPQVDADVDRSHCRARIKAWQPDSATFMDMMTAAETLGEVDGES